VSLEVSAALDLWSRLRGLFSDELTFSEIKNVAGTAGVPISRLAHLVQTSSLRNRGATKDQLMSGVDALAEELSANEQQNFVSDFINEAVRRKPALRGPIDEILKRVGWKVDEGPNLSITAFSNTIAGSQMNPIIFISHSSTDIQVGDALLRVLKDAFGLRSNEIRFTSHPAYGLSGGADPDKTLRQEVVSSKLVIGLITADSVESQYVLFELGARWGTDGFLIPLLAGGARASDLPKPLKSHALTCDNEESILRFVADCGEIIGRPADNAAAYMESVRRLVAASRGAESTKQQTAEETKSRDAAEALSELAAEVLAAVQSEQDPDSRGVTEIIDSPEFNKTFFFASVRDQGNPYSVPTPRFRRAIAELIEKGWLEEAEPMENTLVYRYGK
jgi:hypothetical protein